MRLSFTTLILGRTYVKQKKQQQAIEVFTEFLKRNPKEPYVRLELGTLYAELGQRQEAIQQYEQLLKVNPDMAKKLYDLLRP